MISETNAPCSQSPPSTDSRKPDYWLLLACALASAAFVLPEVLARPLLTDDGYYLWAAKQIALGVSPCRDFFCIDPAGALAFFRLLLPVIETSSVAYWAVMAATILGTAVMLGVLACRVAGTVTAGIWAGFIYTAFQFRCLPPYSLIGKDSLAFTFVLPGLLLCSSRKWWLCGHLLVGVGLSIKPTLGALWLVWMACDLLMAHGRRLSWLLRAAPAAVAIGIPFLAATFWAESQGWGLLAIKTTLGLRSGGGYGSYLSGPTLYNLIHALIPMLWMSPLAVLGLRSLLPINPSLHRTLLALGLGGMVNWLIQPMFNSWYFFPFFGGIVVLAGIGLVRILPRPQDQLALMLSAGLFLVFVPFTNLRCFKLIADIKGKEPYTLAEHHSRVIAQSVLSNTPPNVQQWIREEVSKIVAPGGKVGVLVTDGSLLWALRDYRAGYWATWSPSWNPRQLAEGVAAGTADVIVGVEPPSTEVATSYSNQLAKLNWQMPELAVSALSRNYEPISRKYGYIIYRRRLSEAE